MSNPYVGEIRMFGGSFAPAGWMFCDGQLLPISENETLFNLIGTTYGGDGQSTFALPDLRGRVPIHMGKNPTNSITYQIAEKAGEESVTLTVQQMTLHSHAFLGTTNQASAFAPSGQVPAVTQLASTTAYGTDNPLVALSSQAIGPAGGSQPHENLQPYLAINFIISLFGVFPTQT
jgi:microcystin-dependent protein